MSLSEAVEATIQQHTPRVDSYPEELRPVWSVLVKLYEAPDSFQTLYSWNPKAVFQAGSCGKAGPGWLALEKVKDGELTLGKKLRLEDRHRVAEGTGVLKHFQAGTSLTLEQALWLAFAESDNTAINLVVEELGGLKKVYNKLQRVVEWTGLDLENNPEERWQSGEITPEDLSWFLEKIFLHKQGEVIRDAMRRSHFAYGLRGQLESPGWLFRNRHKLTAIMAQASPKLALWFAQRRPRSRFGLTKEGLVNYGGLSYRLDAGFFFLRKSTGRIVEIVAMYKGPEEPYGLDHSALPTIAGIGRNVYDHFSQS